MPGITRIEGQEVTTLWKFVHRCLFRKVRVQIESDIWYNRNLGAPQPEEDSDKESGQLMVVSREPVAQQVRDVIQWREEWLIKHNLALDTVILPD